MRKFYYILDTCILSIVGNSAKKEKFASVQWPKSAVF